MFVAGLDVCVVVLLGIVVVVDVDAAGAGRDAGVTFFGFLGGEPRFIASLSRVSV